MPGFSPIFSAQLVLYANLIPIDSAPTAALVPVVGQTLQLDVENAYSL